MGAMSAPTSGIAIDGVRPGSDRNFGFVFAAVFALIGLLPLIGGHAPRWWALAVGAVFLAVALVRPAILAPLNVLWFRFGMLLHRVVSPVIMAVLFFATITPLAVLMRALGKDPLRLKRSTGTTYWIARDPPGPRAGSLKDQF
jgi:hypothetical protein